jgi:predicted transcriptional regulator
MARKIIINLGTDENSKPIFKIGHLDLQKIAKMPKMEWHGIAPHFSATDKELPASAFRQLLSDEKARIIHTISSKKPVSVYALAKLLGRDFKAVRQDIRLLEQFGIVKLVKEKSGKRPRSRPVMAEKRIDISFEM